MSIHHEALVLDLADRLRASSYEETRLVELVLLGLEIARAGGDRQWERRVSTGPGDVDRSYHLVLDRPREVVATLCNGSWPASDATETRLNVPFTERCGACWRRAVAANPIGLALVDAAEQLAAEDVASAGAREAARTEMVDQQRCSGLTASWCPRCGDCSCAKDGHGEMNSPSCPLHAPSSPHAEIHTADFAPEHYLTPVGGAEPYVVEIDESGGEG